MKKVWCFLLVSLLLVVSFGAMSCTPGATDTSEKTVKTYLSNYEKLDPGLANLFIKEKRTEYKAHFEHISQHFSFKIKDLEIEVLSQTENSAMVQARYTSVVTRKDKSEIKSFRIVEQFELIKQNGQWLIAEETGISCEEVLN